MKKFLILLFLLTALLFPHESYATTSCNFRFLDNTNAKNDVDKENGVSTISPGDTFYVHLYNLNASTSYKIIGKDSNGRQFTDGGSEKPSETSINDPSPHATFGPINSSGGLAVGNYTIYAYESSINGDGSQCGISTLAVRNHGTCKKIVTPSNTMYENYCLPGYVPADDGGVACICRTTDSKNTVASELFLTPTPIPLPPACEKKDNSYVCDTALGDINTDPASFVKSIFGILLSVAGGIALILIMVSGYRLMASQGNPEKVQAAREQLTSAIVGLLFIIFSLSILQIIGVDILRIPGFK